MSKTFETKADAIDWAREVERKLKRGEIDDLDPATQKTTVADAIKSYREQVLPTLAREGKGTGDVHLRRIETEFGPLFVSALRALAINTWARSLTKDEGLGPQSIIHHLNTFSGLIQHTQTALGVHTPAGNQVKLVARPFPGAARDRVCVMASSICRCVRPAIRVMAPTCKLGPCWSPSCAWHWPPACARANCWHCGGIESTCAAG
ncbi:MAG: hypothetical protein EPN79_05615 [Burkholderiaceae bacterium]|nr:MAG: hypothetical protein EPN79_05615 [Burkholderiaceae bacterium]TBR75840.1 MAG: hypothetical protein EPN64_10225 [Burkholderiaceae bacterium]